MLTRSQIQRLVEQHIDYGVGPGLIMGSKHYYLYYRGSDELEKDLGTLMPYAPHWRINDGVLCTSKLVYARIISDIIQSRGCSVNIIFGQTIPLVLEEPLFSK